MSKTSGDNGILAEPLRIPKDNAVEVILLSLGVQEMEKNGLNSTVIYFSDAGTNLLRCKNVF